MPSSLPTFDEKIELYLREARPASVLDIGAGDGKYGRMARRACPGARLTAVEVDAQYVEQFALRAIYDEVIVADAATLMDDPRRSFDCVIIGDCIEHMRKSAGMDLLHFLVYRSKAIFLKFPAQMVQGAKHERTAEAHVSVWSEQDFSQFDHIYLQRDVMRLCIVRGYLSQMVEWLPAKLMRELGYTNVAGFYDEKPERWELADLVSRRRDAMAAELNKLLGPADRFILADEMQSGLWEWAGGRALPFVEKDGQYWGMPADDESAIAEIERQRRAGAKFIIFISPTTWAIDHYAGMAAWLRKEARVAIDDERMVAFAL